MNVSKSVKGAGVLIGLLVFVVAFAGVFNYGLKAMTPPTAKTVHWQFTATPEMPLSLTRAIEGIEGTCRLVRTNAGYKGRIETSDGATKWHAVPEPSRAHYFGEDPTLRHWMKRCGAVFSGVPGALPVQEV